MSYIDILKNSSPKMAEHFETSEKEPEQIDLTNFGFLLNNILKNGQYSIDQSKNIEHLMRELENPNNYFWIVKNLENVSLSSPIEMIEKGVEYETEIIVNEGFIIRDVSIFMGKNDITEDCLYNNTIKLDSVTDNVLISISATEKTNEEIINKGIYFNLNKDKKITSSGDFGDTRNISYWLDEKKKFMFSNHVMISSDIYKEGARYFICDFLGSDGDYSADCLKKYGKNLVLCVKIKSFIRENCTPCDDIIGGCNNIDIGCSSSKLAYKYDIYYEDTNGEEQNIDTLGYNYVTDIENFENFVFTEIVDGEKIRFFIDKKEIFNGELQNRNLNKLFYEQSIKFDTCYDEYQAVFVSDESLEIEDVYKIIDKMKGE